MHSPLSWMLFVGGVIGLAVAASMARAKTIDKFYKGKLSIILAKAYNTPMAVRERLLNIYNVARQMGSAATSTFVIL